MLEAITALRMPSSVAASEDDLVGVPPGRGDRPEVDHRLAARHRPDHLPDVGKVGLPVLHPGAVRRATPVIGRR